MTSYNYRLLDTMHIQTYIFTIVAIIATHLYMYNLGVHIEHSYPFLNSFNVFPAKTFWAFSYKAEAHVCHLH